MKGSFSLGWYSGESIGFMDGRLEFCNPRSCRVGAEYMDLGLGRKLDLLAGSTFNLLK
jgi:hypothetical protein